MKSVDGWMRQVNIEKNHVYHLDYKLYVKNSEIGYDSGIVFKLKSRLFQLSMHSLDPYDMSLYAYMFLALCNVESRRAGTYPYTYTCMRNVVFNFDNGHHAFMDLVDDSTFIL